MSIISWILCAGAVFVAAAPALAAELSRQDFRTVTTDGVGIQLREVLPPEAAGGEPLLLVHGARVPGLASFDLEAPGGSLAEDLARRLRRAVYIMDARGYGGSNRPAALSRPSKESRPQARAHEVVRDIDAALQAIRQRSGARQVALLGWATGGMWCAFYASLWPDNVSHLVTLNALYGSSDRHPSLGPDSANADPADRHRIKSDMGGYAIYDAASLFPGWDRSIPSPDKASWRDPAVAEAYARAALASDPTSPSRSPAAFRAPLGAIEDSFYQAGGRRLFDAGSITAATLVVRSDLDFWSRPEDMAAFVRDAARARRLKSIALPNATHFVHLERAERGRAQLIDEIAAFLAEP